MAHLSYDKTVAKMGHPVVVVRSDVGPPSLVVMGAAEEVEAEEEPEEVETRQGHQGELQFCDETKLAAEGADAADDSRNDCQQGDDGEDVLNGEEVVEMAYQIEVRDVGKVGEEKDEIGYDCQARERGKLQGVSEPNGAGLRSEGRAAAVEDAAKDSYQGCDAGSENRQ